MISVAPEDSLTQALHHLKLPGKNTHKGQNGKLLVIGGSSIFHAASIWAAEAASKVVDMVHYSSTKENGEIMTNLKSRFVDGIVIRQQDLLNYVEEDDCILIGPGMERGSVRDEIRDSSLTFEKICQLENEAEYTYTLIRFLIQQYPDKRFVFDAAALQMMDVSWLSALNVQPIVTPHCKEFEVLFGIAVCDIPLEEKKEIIRTTARKHNCIILFKQITDIITNGDTFTTVTGGNAGLTKGGTGDVLAGITAALFTKNEPQISALVASYLLKKTSEDLFLTSGTLYNTSDVIAQLPKSAKPVLFDN